MVVRSEEESVKANFEQYGTERHYLSGLLADACWHDLWVRPLFNAIVADRELTVSLEVLFNRNASNCLHFSAPYGIREKGRTIGKKPRKEHWTLVGSEQ